VQITADARRRLKDLDVDTDRIWAERQRIVEDTQDLAKQLLALAEGAAERFPADEDPVEASLDEPYAAPALNGEVAEPAEEYEEAPPVGEAEPNGEGDAFDGDVTQIMPPIAPDEGEAP
jgi:hypothetical protein